MAWMTRELRVMVCLGMVCIMLVMTAGCSDAIIDAFFPSKEMSEEDCERETGIDRDHCYKNLAKRIGNATLCKKIVDPGPNSKCYLELGRCDKLFSQATGDGAYTKFDCYQYKAIQDQSVRLCEEYLDVYSSYNRNDLNPTGVSKEICIKRVTEKCGHIGQNACFDWYYKEEYCVEGQTEGSGIFENRYETIKCVPGR
jgi:hypothetical protein